MVYDLMFCDLLLFITQVFEKKNQIFGLDVMTLVPINKVVVKTFI